MIMDMEVKHRTAKSLVAKLSSVSEQTRTDALRELRLISKLDPDSRPLISDAGAISYLAAALYSSSHEAQENAAATILNLSISSKETLMSNPELLDALSHVLRNHSSTSTSAAAVQSSAAAIHSLLTVESYRPTVGAKHDIIHALIDIIRSPNSPARSIKDALKALFGVSLYSINRTTMIHLGATEPLFSLILNDGRVGIVEDATAVVAQMAGCKESSEAFSKVSGISVLVDLLDSSTGSSMRIKENAVSALLKLARCGGAKVVEDIWVVGLGVVDGIVDVAKHGSDKGKSKAAALLTLINSHALSSCSDRSGLNLSEDSPGKFDYLFNPSS